MKKPRKPSEAETAILRVLWSHEPCTVKTIHKFISQSKDVGYTTTLKQVQRLLEKGLLAREPGPGKSYMYRTTASAEDTKSKLFDRFVETAFGNSVSDLVMHALGKADTSDEELAEIRAFLKKLDDT
ncbi:MAG: BlaI/MecI/CopY family transcriptional regulator [Hellea sp.]|nr:BlaI/MecI/CopY family transcriptional regulator [Hellea sp.]